MVVVVVQKGRGRGGRGWFVVVEWEEWNQDEESRAGGVAYGVNCGGEGR